MAERLSPYAATLRQRLRGRLGADGNERARVVRTRSIDGLEPFGALDHGARSGGGTSAPDSTGLKFSAPISAGLIDATQHVAADLGHAVVMGACAS
jgi:hypothetical protein